MNPAVPNYPSNPQVFPFFVCHEDGSDVFRFDSETICQNLVLTRNGEEFKTYTGSSASEQLDLFLCGAMQEEGYELSSELQWNEVLTRYKVRIGNKKAA
ncbi:hypothetical protein Q4E40_02720 [Pontibacter sp. BT731]|uniref:hypothetical protein n=1 Tax=Pontibacter coccineus TaxID=3063328 RepID=UPI0026E1AC38|nr:hypothetical protein [Pontibacter sp. BT731]MDO6389026.1 hypothetical protein [Pontibacter sp. BT731]